VSLHGEAVQVLNWSALNFAGLSKILKKHDKVSGVKFRELFQVKALTMPFQSTDILTDLVRAAEGEVVRHICDLQAKLSHDEMRGLRSSIDREGSIQGGQGVPAAPGIFGRAGKRARVGGGGGGGMGRGGGAGRGGGRGRGRGLHRGRGHDG